ncbi:hypothetical protein LTR22_014914 [Elasticomyces elasticus]|nr:hypothetical protein LTR22_014914 [Elasticomyces elasticus]KAK4914373.1 hypothetical protein LTR49_017404 [Elasticomyces elasticus]
MAATSASQDKVFDFFQLPRELRDFIYAGLTCDIIIQGKVPRIQRAVIRSAPIEKLLTLNKQFNDEYDQYVRKASQMVIEDGIAISRKPIPLGKRACDVKRVEIRLLMFADTMYGALDELADHEEWVIATIQSLAKLESIECSYNLCIEPSGEWLENWHEDPFWAAFEAFVNHSGVTTLDRRKEVREDTAEDLSALRTSMASPIPSLATWTKESGWGRVAIEAKDTE